jgi:phytoene dehydrogenase-like protein
MMIKTVCILNALLTADWKTRIFPNGAHFAHKCPSGSNGYLQTPQLRGRNSLFSEPTNIAVDGTEDYVESIERQIVRYAPGFRDCILSRSVSSPKALESWNPNLVGATFWAER